MSVQGVMPCSVASRSPPDMRRMLRLAGCGTAWCGIWPWPSGRLQPGLASGGHVLISEI